jgi:murein DD-endopeptidase MepM/ murein hydrolase activator NlpD
MRGRVRVHRALAVAAGAVVSVLVAGLAWAPAAPADSVAQRKQRLQRQLAELREDLEGTSDDLVDATVELRRSEARLADAQAALVQAQAALARAQQAHADLAARLDVAQAAERKAERDLGIRQAQERRTRGTLGQIAREAYLTSGLSGLSVALQADSPAQFADRVSVAGTALRVQNGAIARLDVVQADTRAREARLTAVRAQVAELERQATVLVRQRQEAQRQAAAAEQQISELVATKARAQQVIAKRKAAEVARIRQAQREQDRLAAILRARAARAGGDTGSWSPGGGALARPVSGSITSVFGMRYHPILHYWRLHGGIDFGVPCGTPVHAAAAGSVVRAGWAGGFGNQVVIDHGRVRGVGLASSSNHLSRIVVYGGRVGRGQLIGYSGTTGLSTGCHLHFEVYRNGARVNPMGWM